MTRKKEDIRQTQVYLSSLGVPEIPPKTFAFDPGYDVTTLTGHILQSGHLMSALKLSMACWQISSEKSTREKIALARANDITVCAGGSPFEIACACGRLSEYLDLCCSLGFERIEAGDGFTKLKVTARDVISLAEQRNLEVHFEVGDKHTGAFTSKNVERVIAQGKEWLDAGALQIVVEARESAMNVGLFSDKGELDLGVADRLASAFGLDNIVFEAPDKSSQFAFIRHFGPKVELCNVRLEEILRVEIFRRGIHSDSFMYDNLRPKNAINCNIKTL